MVFSIALAAFLWGIGCMIYMTQTGIGVWGLNKTISGWAWGRNQLRMVDWGGHAVAH